MIESPLPPRPVSAPAPPAPARRWPKRVFIGFLVVACVAIFGGAGALWYVAHRVSDALPSVESGILGLADLPADLGDPRTFLLIGSDSRADLPDDWVGYGDFGGQRADVIMLVQVIPDTGVVQILSIPRDLRVVVDGTPGRINAEFNDGAAAIVAAVSDFAQTPIHHYLQVDFAGFAGIVDAAGGIEMTFPYPARDRKSKFEVAAGTQVLDGRTALALARSRKYQELRDGEWVFVDASDIGRTRRQQEVLMALITQIDRPSSLGGFGDLVESLSRFVTVDDGLDEDEIIQLAWAMRSLRSEGLDALTLPVEDFEENGTAYVVPSEPEASNALAAFRSGQPLSGAIEGSGRVEVQNGNGVAGSAGEVAQRLQTGGWEVSAVTNSGREDYATTLIVARARHLSQAEAVASFLGYGAVEEGVVPTDTDVLVIVGADALGG